MDAGGHDNVSALLALQISKRLSVENRKSDRNVDKYECKIEFPPTRATPDRVPTLEKSIPTQKLGRFEATVQ